MKINYKKKNYIPFYLSALLLIISLCVSILVYLLNYPGKRRTFIFPSADSGKYVVEYRYLPMENSEEEINMYVDEILLGSGVERTKLLFTLGTEVESCFLRDGVLYLNLSEDLIQIGNGVIEIKEGIELLKTNLESNFYKIKRVEVFVDGKYAYESKVL